MTLVAIRVDLVVPLFKDISEEDNELLIQEATDEIFHKTIKLIN